LEIGFWSAAKDDCGIHKTHDTIRFMLFLTSRTKTATFDWGNNLQWMELSLEEFAFIMCTPGFAAPPPAILSDYIHFFTPSSPDDQKLWKKPL
jgi:hypothetical protein